MAYILNGAVNEIQVINPGAGYTPFLPSRSGRWAAQGATAIAIAADAAGGEYTQNRATIHLHGGVTPWISDGTAPNGLPRRREHLLPRSVSVVNVPDMPEPGPGQ